MDLRAVAVLSFGCFFWATALTDNRGRMGSPFGQDYTAFALVRLTNLTENGIQWH